MTEEYNFDEQQESDDWQKRLKHLQPGEDKPVQTEDYVEIHDLSDDEAPARNILPEGVSFRKSRGGKDDGEPDESVMGKILSRVGVNVDAKEALDKSEGSSQKIAKQETNQDLYSIKKQFNLPKKPISVLLRNISANELVNAYKKKKQMVWIAIAAVIVFGILSYAALLIPGGGGMLGYWLRCICTVSIFVCLAIIAKEVSFKFAEKNPSLARRLMAIFSFGSATATREVALLDVDMADYTKAEKTLLGAVKKTNRTRNPRGYITTYAFLCSVRANVGKVVDAERQIVELLDTAKSYYDARQNDANGIMLATTLVYAAKVSNWQDKFKDALRLYTVAIGILCKLKSPPADLLATTLASAGYQYNLAGRYKEALLLLGKADEINEKMPDTRLSTKALIATNIGIAHMGKGNTEKAKIFIKEAEAIAETKLALRELPAVYQAQAILHQVTGFKEAADQAYQKSILSLELQSPADNLQLVRILKEYAEFLKEIDRPKESEKQTNRATQIKYQLDQVNYQAKPFFKEKVEKVKGPAHKPRFPIFFTAITGYLIWDVFNAGLRNEETIMWVWAVGFSIVLILKLFAKYGKHAEEESSAGFILEILGRIPFIRYVVPELSVLPKMTCAIVIAIGLIILVFVSSTKPIPHSVPDSGLLSYEYTILGRNLAINGNTILAMKALEKAKSPDFSGDHRETIAKIEKYFLPKYEQPVEALKLYSNSIVNEVLELDEYGYRVKRKRPEAAMKTWRQLIEKNPNFELPYASLAQTLAENREMGEAVELAQKAYEINPDNFHVLISNARVQFLQRTKKSRIEAQKYLDKAKKDLEEVGASEAILYDLMMLGADQLETMTGEEKRHY